MERTYGSPTYREPHKWTKGLWPPAEAGTNSLTSKGWKA